MNDTLVRIGKAVKTLGLMGVMMALAAFLAIAPSASASTASASTSEVGKLALYVDYAQLRATDGPAMVGVADMNGNTVAKGTVARDGSYITYLPPGTYKVIVYARGYKTYSQVVEITSNEATVVKAALERDSR